MKIKLQVNIKKLEKQLRKLSSGYIETIKNTNIKTARALAKAARNNLKLNLTDNTGVLRSSLQILRSQQGGLVVVFGSELFYAKDVEFGTGPHNLSKNDFENLSDWVRKKLGIPKKDVFIVTKFIADKIKFEGTDPQPFLGPAFAVIKRKYIKTLSRAARKENKKL